MTIDREVPFVRLALGAGLLLAVACQGPASNDANAVGANGAAASQVAGPAPDPVTMEPDPANQTGPVARAVDAGFPEPCQAYVREIQACIDTLTGPAAAARLLPSGDPYYLAQGAERELLLPEAHRRAALWTPRVWPGAVLVAGEIIGTWRRADMAFTMETWRRLSRQEQDAVVAEAESMPLAGAAARVAFKVLPERA